VKIGVLIVRDNEHNVANTVGGDGVACRTLPSLGHVRENPGAQIWLAGPRWWHHKSDLFKFITIIFVFYSLKQI
jgi:hypothetical protein